MLQMLLIQLSKVLLRKSVVAFSMSYIKNNWQRNTTSVKINLKLFLFGALGKFSESSANVLRLESSPNSVSSMFKLSN